MMMLMFLLLSRVLLLLMLLPFHAEYRVYLHAYRLQTTTQQRDTTVHTTRPQMTCRPTAEPLMACAEGVVLDHPAPLAE